MVENFRLSGFLVYVWRQKKDGLLVYGLQLLLLRHAIQCGFSYQNEHLFPIFVCLILLLRPSWSDFWVCTYLFARQMKLIMT